MPNTVDKIAALTKLRVAWADALDADALPVNNTLSDAETIIALSLTNLKHQRVLEITGADAAADYAEMQRRDRLDDAAERDEERGFYRRQSR